MSGTGEMPPVVLEGLTVRYGKTTAVDRVSLAVEPGAVYALLGRNGAGKSSAVRALLGQRRQDGGRALLFGRDAWRGRREAMLRTGVVAEESDAPPEMTAPELVAFSAKIYPAWDAGASAARLERFRIPPRVPFGRLSKGQKRQVMLALALGHRPALLVLDDPTLGLDPVARREFFEELVGDLAERGTTVLLTTHDLDGVERIATRVGIMRQGGLAVDEPLEVLKERFRRVRLPRGNGALPGPQAVAAVGAIDVREREWGIEAVIPRFDDDARRRLEAAGGAALPEVAPMALEDIFAAVAGDAGTGGAA